MQEAVSGRKGDTGLLMQCRLFSRRAGKVFFTAFMAQTDTRLSRPISYEASLFRRGARYHRAGKGPVCSRRVDTVTIDKSLRRRGKLVRSRNVLKRGERIARLQFEDRWMEGQSPLGLPKVRVIKTVIGKKKKKKAKDEESEEK